MPEINPYLTFNGNCEAAFIFYKTVFGNDFLALERLKDMPGGKPVSESFQNKIMHISLPIGKETILMGSDLPEEQQNNFAPGNNIAISVNTANEEEAIKIFNALSQEGTITMAMDKTFWGALFGMCIDQFGIQWMVNYDYKKQEIS